MDTYTVLVVFASVAGVCQATHMADLYNELFANYNPHVLPKCSGNEAVQVRIGLALRQIIDLNEPRQVIETDTWVRLNWHDCNLKWNSTANGINNLAVPYQTIWTPDITLYDNAQNELGGSTSFRPNIYPNGDVYYNFPAVIKSLCKVDVKYFPFDTQICKMQFGSWSYHGWDLNITARDPPGDISSYISNGEWAIAGLPGRRHELFYQCCPEPYPDITFYIQIRRKPLFYLMNLIFPCTVISTMAFLGFLLPPDSGEKVSLEITVLLSLAVFLLVVSETMPPDSETFPFIGLYFACAMLLVSISCLMTVTVLNLHFKGDFGKKLPPWVRSVFLNCLGKLLFVKVKNERHAGQYSRHHQRPVEGFDNHSFAGGHVSTDDCPTYPSTFTSTETDNENNISKILNDINHVNHSHVTSMNDVTVAPGSASEVSVLLRKQLECLETIHGYMDDKLRIEINMGDWKILAQVVDRIFMVLFFIFQVTTTLAILIRISTANPPVHIE